jgi:tetratricopeptide (TPR) repeat protein
MGSPNPEEALDASPGADGEDLDFEIAFFEAILQKLPNSVDVLMALSNNYTRQGLFEKGMTMDKRLCKIRTRDPIVRYNLACSYSLLGQLDESFDALQQAVTLGYRDLAFLQKDPDLEGMRRDPRYARFLERLLHQIPKS